LHFETVVRAPIVQLAPGQMRDQAGGEGVGASIRPLAK